MKAPLNDAMIEEVSGLFAALGDGSRLKILRALQNAKGPLSQGAVSEAAGLSQANASKHLALLVQVGLVLREQQGNLVFFKPVEPIVEELCDLVCGHVKARIENAYHAMK